MKRRIGIFGGSFNPIHCGHIALAHQLRQTAALDEVWLMVSPQNPLKQGSGDMLDERLRLLMARIALHGEDGIRACDYEMRMPRPSYTWNTLQRLKADFAGCRFALLIGGDNWQLFPQWYRADDILREHEVVVYPRTEEQRKMTAHTGRVTMAEAQLLPVSSTLVRQRVRSGESIGGLVPKAIETLVKRCYGRLFA